MGKQKGKYILLWTALLCVVVLWAALSFGGTMTLSLGEMCHALFPVTYQMRREISSSIPVCPAPWPPFWQVLPLLLY